MNNSHTAPTTYLSSRNTCPKCGVRRFTVRKKRTEILQQIFCENCSNTSGWHRWQQDAFREFFGLEPLIL